MISLVLCAGLGTRLRPITFKWPKPLVPMWSDSLNKKTTPAKVQIDKIIQLNRLLVSSIEHKICLNSHYLSDQVQNLGDENSDIEKVFFEKEILGTAGPLSSVYESLKDTENFSQGLLVLNGDIFHDLDLHEFVMDSITCGCDVSLLAKDVPSVNSLCVDKNSNLNALKGRFGDESLTRKTLTFCGISWYSEKALKKLSIDERDIREFWNSLLKYSENPIKVIEQKGYWEDIGSFEGLFKAQSKWIESLEGECSEEEQVNELHFLFDTAREDFKKIQNDVDLVWSNVWVYSESLSKQIVLENLKLENAIVIDDVVWKLNKENH
jgi:mannose-1-phosphate guanylyltransferase